MHHRVRQGDTPQTPRFIISQPLYFMPFPLLHFGFKIFSDPDDFAEWKKSLAFSDTEQLPDGKSRPDLIHE